MDADTPAIQDEVMLRRWAIEPMQFMSTLPELTFEMIATLKEPPKLRPLNGSTRCNTVLSTLPYDILIMILDLLNFRDLVGLLRTCHDAKRLVEWFPAFRLVREHAPKALVALRRGGLLTVHPPLKIYKALRRSRCEYCDAYGPFLFLVTAVRCCLRCLDTRKALHLVPASALRQASRDGVAVLRLPLADLASGQDYTRIGRIGDLEMAASIQAMEALIARGLEVLDLQVGKEPMLVAFAPFTVLSPGGFPAVIHFKNRSTTENIDYMLSPEWARDTGVHDALAKSVKQVTNDLGYSHDWFNDSVSMFVTKEARAKLFEAAEKQGITLWEGENSDDTCRTFGVGS